MIKYFESGGPEPSAQWCATPYSPEENPTPEVLLSPRRGWSSSKTKLKNGRVLLVLHRDERPLARSKENPLGALHPQVDPVSGPSAPSPCVTCE
ncbi:hypothetical protein GCM10010446_38270 [Streptomyces enissocaesilis]|uniref:Uncharacterized protein n=1 Tax=Streptomyces enissocaesilis TaxID=332589 RepID=A0ABN3XFQ3_9ACTN